MTVRTVFTVVGAGFTTLRLVAVPIIELMIV